MLKIPFILAAPVVLSSSCGREAPAFDQSIVDLSEPGLGSVSRFFVTDNRLWVTNDNGAIYASADSGLSWKSYATPLNKKPKYLYFSNDNENGVIVGDAGLIHHTKDGGNVWESIEI